MFYDIKKILRVTGHGWIFIFLLILRSPFDLMSTLIQAGFLQRAFIAVAGKNDSSLTTACLSFGIASFYLFLYNGIIWSIYAPFVTRMEGVMRIKLLNKIASLTCEQIEAEPISLHRRCPCQQHPQRSVVVVSAITV